MKKKLLLASFSLLSAVAFGQDQQPQNKSLGVGTATPNPNAALHVVSPTNNQGFMMPRLTTEQREAMTLGPNDSGLLVYDTDLNDVVFWDGTGWDEGGEETAAAPRSLTSNDTSPTLYVKTNGAVNETDAVLSSSILAETTSGFSALSGRIPVSASQANAISGITKSTDPGSWAGYFDAQAGTAVYGVTWSNLGGALAPVGVYGESRGTGSVGGAFWVQNSANTYPALYTNTIGVGSSHYAEITNVSNVAPVLVLNHGGGGWGMDVILANNATYKRGVNVNHNGSSGEAGYFRTTHASNTSPALTVESAGTGTSLRVQTGTSYAAAHITSTVQIGTQQSLKIQM